MADRRARPRACRAQPAPRRRAALSGDPLLAEALRLDSEAIEAGEETPRGRELRAQAAALRAQSLGERVYPVLVCGSCFGLTGWVSSTGSCDACVRRERLQAAYSDPHGGWVSVAPAPAGAAPQHGRLALRGRGRTRDRRSADEWLRHVEPGETGPVDPEEGYELEVAVRDEVELTDGSGILVRFATATHRFERSQWTRLATTRARRSELGLPTEFAASLPVEQLVEAWGDYREAVAALNRAAWSSEDARREAERQARDAREAALREQRHTADLLGEDR